MRTPRFGSRAAAQPPGKTSCWLSSQESAGPEALRLLAVWARAIIIISDRDSGSPGMYLATAKHRFAGASASLMRAPSITRFPTRAGTFLTTPSTKYSVVELDNRETMVWTAHPLATVLRRHWVFVIRTRR